MGVAHNEKLFKYWTTMMKTRVAYKKVETKKFEDKETMLMILETMLMIRRLRTMTMFDRKTGAVTVS